MIRAFFHCKRCLELVPDGGSPKQFARLEVGSTERGIQIRCVRHDINVLHVDFEGQKHPYDASEADDFSKAGKPGLVQ